MINAATRERLFGFSSALDHPLVRGVLVAVVASLALAPVVFGLLGIAGKLSPALKKDLWSRYFSWLVFIPLMIGPVLLGAGPTILAVGVLSLLCYREFARATGLFRFPGTSAVVVGGILLITFAVADHWYGLFVALTSLVTAVIAATAIFADQPKGYIQRVALGIFAFLLFGVCYGHLGYLANDKNYRALLIWLVVCVELNDVFAYCVGKTLGHKKLAPNTSPNKTIAGSVGAVVLTTALAASLGHLVFRNTILDAWPHLLALGLIVSVSGQLGDLALSSIKRDLGIKDWAATFPGHGGLLDRFNSLLFAAPAVFHYVGYFVGVGLDQQIRIFTGP
jgi:phosphatidate cytidylyltransferase